jgi:lipid II:glycine glycyltransferase (peptidoglycan interpeptide bridge formation enzyme)
MPMMKVVDYKGKSRWVTLPFSDYFHAVASAPEDKSAFFANLYNQLMNKQTYEFREKVTADGIQYSQCDWLHWVPLGPTLQDNQYKMRSNHRKSLAVAKRKGGEARICTDLAGVRDFYDLQLMTRKRKGLPVQPRRFFDNLYKNVISQGQGFIIGIYVDDQCIAGALCLYWGDVLTMKYAASDSNYFTLRPNHQVYWEAIQWGVDHGFKRLDLGKTSKANEGLRKFNLMWGAEEEPMMYSHLNAKTIPTSEDDEDEHPVIRLVSKSIQNGPDWICKGIGELFYRFFV